MKKHVRRWLHLRGIHWFCRVYTSKVVTGFVSDFSPVYLVGLDENGVEQRVDATVFGGSRKPVHEWRSFHG